MTIKMINTWWSTLDDVSPYDDHLDWGKQVEGVCSKIFIKGFGSDEAYPESYESELLRDFLESITLAKDNYQKTYTSSMIGGWKYVAFLEAVTNDHQKYTNRFLPMLGFKRSETFNNMADESKDVWCWLVSKQEFDEKLEALLKDHS